MSLGLALVLGTAGLPHILIRFYTVPTAKAARRSVIWAIGIIGSFYILTTFLGFGAAALVGADRIKEADAAGNMAGPLLAQTIGGGEGSIGGDLFLAFIAAVAFATILAVVAGLTITASSSFAHDFYAAVMRRGQERDEAAEVRVARIAALVIGAIAIVLASFARGQNVAFLVGLAFAVAASANLPTILFSLYWKRFTTSGAVTGILVGLFGSLLLVVIGPNVMGPKGLIFTGSEPLFPLENPGIVSIPLGFAAAWLGTMLSREPASEEMYEELRVRSLTGLGAEEAEAAPARTGATRRQADRYQARLAAAPVHDVDLELAAAVAGLPEEVGGDHGELGRRLVRPLGNSRDSPPILPLTATRTVLPAGGSGEVSLPETSAGTLPELGLDLGVLLEVVQGRGGLLVGGDRADRGRVAVDQVGGGAVAVQPAHALGGPDQGVGLAGQHDFQLAGRRGPRGGRGCRTTTSRCGCGSARRSGRRPPSSRAPGC